VIYVVILFSPCLLNCYVLYTICVVFDEILRKTQILVFKELHKDAEDLENT